MARLWRDLLRLLRAFDREERRQLKLATKRWKRQQLSVAEILGGECPSDTGMPGPDVVASPFLVKVKTTNKLPQWLIDTLGRARRNAANSDGVTHFIPLVVLAEVSQGKKARRYAIMALEDLRKVADVGKG